jgi:hypothetical protein
MNSSWLLIKTLRKRLLICGALCFLAQFLLVYADLRPSDVDKAALLQSLSLTFALVFSCLAGFHTALFKLPFPVTHRQLAWIPTLCLGALWAAGFAGLFAGISVFSIMSGYGLSPWIPFVVAVLKSVPFAFLIFALGDRVIRYLGFGAIGFAGLFQFFYIGEPLEGMDFALELYHYGWPLCIALGIFLILEGPTHIAAMECPFPSKQGLVNLNVRQPGSPIRSPTIKIWADMLMVLPCLLLVIWYFSRLHLSSNLDHMSTFFRIYFVGIGVAALFGIRFAWQSAQANGFTPGKSIVVFLMKCSMVLWPISMALGAKRGVVATCDQCRQYKFLWGFHCPHCGHVNHGTAVRTFPTLPWRKNIDAQPKKKPVWTSRSVYRIFIPVQLAIFGVITSHFPTYFQSETVYLSRTQEGLQTFETAFAEAREYLASIEDVRAWLDTGPDGPTHLPKRFHLEIQDHWFTMGVCCYWLRWEDGGDVGERIETRITEAFPEALFTVSGDIGKTDHHRKSVNRLVLPTFLDDGIHWDIWRPH